MGLDAVLLRDSLQLVISRQPDITAMFYDRLFERFPEARPLFGRNSRELQERMLAEALVAVVDHLEDEEWLRSTLSGLGARHVEYGVTPGMYGWVADALMSTLADVAGDDWTPAHEAAWREAIGTVATLMLADRLPSAAHGT